MFFRFFFRKPAAHHDAEHGTCHDAFGAGIGKKAEEETDRKRRCHIDVPQADLPLIVEPARNERVRLHSFFLGLSWVLAWQPLARSCPPCRHSSSRRPRFPTPRRYTRSQTTPHDRSSTVCAH